MYISIISLILITIILILIIYTLCFSDVRDNGVNGYLSRLITKKIPKYVCIGIKYCIGNNIVEYVESCYDYVVNRRNPVMQIIYLLLINIAYIIWLIYGSHLLPTYLAHSYHNYIVFAMLMISQYSYYLACAVSPGIINSDTVQCFNHQAYDGLLYIDGTTCSSCNVLKPARSKHCTLCGCCVPIFDHHCIWINQCVGELNHRYFLMFLFTNMLFFFYGSYVLFLVITSEVFERNLLSATFVNRLTGHRYQATVYIVINFILIKHFELACLFIFALVMGIAICLFLTYHIYLLYNGTTTNETFKYETFQRIHIDMVAAHQRYIIQQQQQQQHDLPPSIIDHHQPKDKKNQSDKAITNNINNIDRTNNDIDRAKFNGDSNSIVEDIMISQNIDTTVSVITDYGNINSITTTVNKSSRAIAVTTSAVSLENIKLDSEIIGCVSIPSIVVLDATSTTRSSYPSDHHTNITKEHENSTTVTTSTSSNICCSNCSSNSTCRCNAKHYDDDTSNNTTTSSKEVPIKDSTHKYKSDNTSIQHQWHPIRIVCEEYDDIPQILPLDPGIWPSSGSNIYRLGIRDTYTRVFWPTSEILLNNLQQQRHDKKKNE